MIYVVVTTHQYYKELFKFCQRNIYKFINEVKEIKWSGIIEMDDAQLACSAFHKLLAEKCASCFFFNNIAKHYFHKKTWLKAGLKESIKMKNKLYGKIFIGRNTEEKCE